MKHQPAALAALLLLGATAAAACAVAAEAFDGRSEPSERQNKYAVRNNIWLTVQSNPAYWESWFRRYLRCSKTTFDIITSQIEARWTKYYERPKQNSAFFIPERVAVTLYYLTHEGTLAEAGQVFGMGKTTATVAVNKVINLIVKEFLCDIHLPVTPAEWNDIEEEFESKTGFPFAVGAIDGSLFEIKRIADFDGFYCRKGFPAFNVQALVDHRRRFRSFKISPGSQSDQAIFNHSSLSRDITARIPPGRVILADAGYKLYGHVMTPYPIVEGMSKSDSNYNYRHSCSRIVVECAFGLLKNRFAIFRKPLDQTNPDKMADVIKAALILHNWLIDLNDGIVIDDKALPWMHIGGDARLQQEMNLVDGDAATAKRDQIRDYLTTLSQ